MPLAARLTDWHVCPAVNPPPHVGGPICTASPNVSIGYLPAARRTDNAVCVPAIDSITGGSSTVSINFKKAARIGDAMAHGGKIVQGCPTVTIGDSSQSLTIGRAATAGAPFCEECERARRLEGDFRAPLRPPVPPPTYVAAEEVAPPPPARGTLAEQAAKPGKAPAQVQAREAVVWETLSTHSPDLSPAEIDAAVRSLDLERPISLEAAPPDIDPAEGLAIVARRVDGTEVILPAGPLENDGGDP